MFLYRYTKLIAQWLHQKLNVVQLQKKQHVHEKEMQRQKQQQENLLQQDVDVVHQLKDLQLEELLVEELQVLLAERLQENLLVKELQEKLHEDLLHEEGDVNLLSFFYSKFRSNLPKLL